MDNPTVLDQYRWLEGQLTALIGPVFFSKDINLRLERITHLLELLGNPHRTFAAIHVGGTSGKGSTSTMIASILTAAGYKTGLHLSPHLQIENERFQINNRMVPTTHLVRLFKTIQPAIARVTRENPFGAPSYFEAQVALAFCLFAQEKVDVAVVEVGLGGALDGTNVLSPRVAVLTSIGLDHTEVLGDTVDLIARDKVGIIKPGQTVVSGVAQASARRIVAERCASQGAALWQMDRDFAFRRGDSETFSVAVPGRGAASGQAAANHTYAGLTLSMRGDFQMANAACAVAAARAFAPDLPDAAVRDGLRRALVPGRMDLVQERPTVILDGAHNEDKIRAAAAAVNKYYGGKRRIVVLSVKSDKSYRDMLPHILAGASLLIVTAFGALAQRGPVSPQTLAQAAAEAAPGLDIRVAPEPLAAVQLALAEAGPDDLVWVTGSLYLVGEVREHWFPAQNLILQAEESALA